MATKTFKIGEYAQGGIITAVATKTKITIIGKEWDTSTGYNKGSDQSKAKEFTRLEVATNERNADRKLNEFLCDLSTPYWADTIMDWVYTKTEITAENIW
mgnify:CR=1 FL=1|jgi:hypothetical protein